MGYIAVPEGKFPRIALVVFALLLGLHFLQLVGGDSYRNIIPYGKAIQPIKGTAESRTPYPDAFPRKIWQTSAQGPADIDTRSQEAIRTWMKLNHRWRFEVLTDPSAETYVKETFTDRPDIVELYMDIEDPILRADFIRYLVLLGDGGLYCDMDTKALKPILDWIPTEYQRQANVVVGVEYDKMDGERWLDWTLDLQFTNWAMMAKPHHPLMQLTIQRLMEQVKQLAHSQGKAVRELRPSFHEVLDTTGPALFSRAIFEHLSIETGTSFTWLNVTKLEEPILIADILILPITSFGSNQPHSNSGHAEEDDALVQHLFRGSWKDSHKMAATQEPEVVNEDSQAKHEEEKHKI